MRTKISGIMTVLLLAFGFFCLAPKVSVMAEPEKKVDASASLKKGLDFLKGQLKEGKIVINMRGKEFPDVAFTAMVVTSMLEAPKDIRKDYEEICAKSLEYIASSQKEDGSIDPSGRMPNYYTSVCIVALKASGQDKYKTNIEKAANYIVKLQCDNESGSNAGGFGYGAEKGKADLSNTNYALEALVAAKEAGVKIDDEVFKRAEEFVKSCMNNPEANPLAKKEGAQIEPSDDGGAYYQPEGGQGAVELPNGKKQYKSFGSMTYSAIKSLIHCKAKEDDPSLVGARKWIEKNYTLEENPGMKADGLFYYYASFAKAMHVTKSDKIQDIRGKKHDWREELAATLSGIQGEDGSWKNEKSDKWFESDPTLATAFATQALNWSLK